MCFQNYIKYCYWDYHNKPMKEVMHILEKGIHCIVYSSNATAYFQRKIVSECNTQAVLERRYFKPLTSLTGGMLSFGTLFFELGVFTFPSSSAPKD